MKGLVGAEEFRIFLAVIWDWLSKGNDMMVCFRKKNFSRIFEE